MKERTQYFDIIKGIAIFLVVMGHVLTMCVRGIDGVLPFRIISNVHMPLFFFISGWFAWRSGGAAPKMKSRTAKLLIPMVVMSTLFLYVRPHLGLESPLPGNLAELWLDNWKNGYWFTFTLFEIFVLYLVIFRPFAAAKKLWLQVAIIVAMWGLMEAMNIYITEDVKGFLCWQQARDYFPVFMLGVLSHRYSGAFHALCRNNYGVAAAAVTAVATFMVVGWSWKYSTTLVTPMRILFHYALAVVAFAAAKPWSESGVAPKAAALWAFLGRESLAIYFLHYFFLFPMGFFRSFLADQSFIIVASFTAFWAALIVAAALAVNYIISFSRVLSYLLTGSSNYKTVP